MLVESDRTKAEVLARAEHLVLTNGVGDTGEHLCRLNMRYGLAKIHHYQISRNIEPDALFIGAPDATVTRNPNRWMSGFGYGGLLRWSGDFVPLEAKPNGCGLLMVGLAEDPGRRRVLERLERLERTGLSVDGQVLSWDIRHSNHFLELCRPTREAGEQLGWEGPVVLLHSSGGEFRGATNQGPGIYWDKSEALRSMALRHETPWGDLWVVEGEAAWAYLRECHRVHRFQMRRRLALAEALLGPDFQVLFHGMHQGLHDLGTLPLGCYLHDGEGVGLGPFVETPAGLFPVTISAHLPISLLAAEPSLDESILERDPRFAHLTEKQRLWAAQANLLPHGGGTALRDLTDVSVSEQGDRRLFRGRIAGRPVTFEHPRDLPFSYRGREVLDKTTELGLGREKGSMEVTWWIGADS